MIGKTAVVVDSACYLPDWVVKHFGLRVVPLSVYLDDREYREFVDLDADTFYRRLAAGASVRTSQPSPGAFVAAYRAAAESGAEQIVSVHIGSALSGTVNSARLAAKQASVPVEVVDSGQASFVEGLCVWEVCEALEAGASIAEAAGAGLRAGAAAGNVFLVRGLELLAQGGRLAPGAGEFGGVPILAYQEGAVRPIAQAATPEAALDAITRHVQRAADAAPAKRFRIGVGNGACDELAAELERRLAALPSAEEVIPYLVGPAVGAHTGPGCTGAVFLGLPV